MIELITFPKSTFKNSQFKDIYSFKKLLINEAKQLDLNKAESWFKLSETQGQYTILICKYQEQGCKAMIKLAYHQQDKNFTVEEVDNIHNHSKVSQQKQSYQHAQNCQGTISFNQIKEDKTFKMQKIHYSQQMASISEVQKIKQNYLLINKLKDYTKAQLQKDLDSQKDYILQIGSSCASNPGPSAIAYCLKTESQQYFRVSRVIGDSTNNEAEFTALIQSLLDCYENKVKKIKIFSNNSIVISSMSVNGKVKANNLIQFWEGAKLLAAQFSKCQVVYKKRQKGDYLSKLCKFRLKI